MIKKKKILWCSDFSRLFTGFGRNSKIVLKYLYDTKKYDIIEYACAPFTFEDKRLSGVPWKAYGAIPNDPFVQQELNSNPQSEVSTRYGGFHIDDLIQKEKPDFYIGVNDFWAFQGYYDKPWWNKVNCALWVTLDSLPIFDDALENAHKIKNFWVWSNFAEKELNRKGFYHVKTLHGAFDVSDFHPLENRAALRKKFNIDNNFIFGFVFRNQGRKLIGTLLEAFSLLKKEEPENNSKLLLHTCWAEGWDINKFIKEFSIDSNDVLTTHVCANCKKYDIRPYEGEKKSCKFCHCSDSVFTPNGGLGISEKEMNEVYNMMDFYIHPITSGGLEMPLVESLLAGTPISTVNYSCGEEFCDQDFVTPIKFSTYREMGSQFIKSQPDAKDIKRIMSEVKGNPNLKDLSTRGREWALKEFDFNTICKKIEEWIDNSDFAVHDYPMNGIQNDNYPFRGDILDDKKWAVDLIKNVFGIEESEKSEITLKIVDKIAAGSNRKTIYEDAISAAKQNNDIKRKNSAENFFKNDEEISNVCVISPDSLEDKLNLGKFIKNLATKENNIYLVGDSLDREIFSQFANFVLIPKSGEPNKQIEWMRNLKNSKGLKRFKGLYIKNQNELVYIENE